MHEGVWFRKNNFWLNDSCENLDQFSLLGLLYMHRWCLHGPINSYYSFWWNNLILCRYNVDTLNICMKEFGSQKIILTKWQLWELRQLFPNMAFVYALIVPLWALCLFYYRPLLDFHQTLQTCSYMQDKINTLDKKVRARGQFYLSYFPLYVDTLNICMKEFGSQKIILTKWQLWELRQLFPNMAFVYALIVPLWALCLFYYRPLLDFHQTLQTCSYMQDKINTLDKKVRARGQFYLSYFPL